MESYITELRSIYIRGGAQVSAARRLLHYRGLRRVYPPYIFSVLHFS